MLYLLIGKSIGCVFNDWSHEFEDMDRNVLDKNKFEKYYNDSIEFIVNKFKMIGKDRIIHNEIICAIDTQDTEEALQRSHDIMLGSLPTNE